MPKQRTWTRRLVVGCLLIGLLSCLGLSTFVIAERQRVQTWITAIGMIADAPQYAQMQSAEDTLTYLADNPDSFGLVVYSVDVEGDADLSESHIFHNADEPLPLASTAKIVVLAAYARAVAAGEIDSAETISLAEWDQYHVPNANGGAHIAALNELGIETDANGYAQDDTRTVTAGQLARAMIEHSDNAAPEWLIDRLGYEAIQSVIDDLDLSDHLRLLPHSGLIATLQNHEQDVLTAEYIDQLLAMERAQFEALVWDNQQRWVNESGWGAEARAFWQGDVPPRDPRLEMLAMDQLSAQGTARDFATIMAGVATDTLFSAEVSQIMRSYLEWPMKFGVNQAEFRALGSKGGTLLGILTGATYFEPLIGDYANQPRIVVLFMRDVPLSAWLGFNNQFAHRLLQFQLAKDAAFSETVRDALE